MWQHYLYTSTLIFMAWLLYTRWKEISLAGEQTAQGPDRLQWRVIIALSVFFVMTYKTIFL
jgi:hypothetical protein